jgi:glycosyltransferase involved in cell wall biosynthesis
MSRLKVALFSDSHYEANGVARTTCALEHYARDRNLQLLSVHAGPTTRRAIEGSIIRLELQRSRYSAIPIEHDLQFDVLMWRHVGRVMRELRAFAPDVLHFTGPSDIGLMGMYAGVRLGIPLVGSWHTNLHEYATRRLHLGWLPRHAQHLVRRLVELVVLNVCVLFYRLPHVLLAPNHEWQQRLQSATGLPTMVMTRGVDTELFTPHRRTRTDTIVNIGYVGRLSPEKSVRVLAQLERALTAAGLRKDVRFTIVGHGNEREWLEQHMSNATFTGVLTGDRLSSAFANMDLLVFPSQTETVGNVVLEALASGVPVVAMAQGGPQFVGTTRESAELAADHEEMVARVINLVRDERRRRAMRAAARTWAEGRSWDSIFDGVYRAYAQAVTSPSWSRIVPVADVRHHRSVDFEAQQRFADSDSVPGADVLT